MQVVFVFGTTLLQVQGLWLRNAMALYTVRHGVRMLKALTRLQQNTSSPVAARKNWPHRLCRKGIRLAVAKRKRLGPTVNAALKRYNQL